MASPDKFLYFVLKGCVFVYGVLVITMVSKIFIHICI